MLNRIFSGGSRLVEVNVEEAHRRQVAGALLLDVREPDEWAAGHAPQARHVPLGQLPARLQELPTDRDLLVICRSGARSARAVELLQRAGYTHAANVAGGMTAWAGRRLPVSRT